MQERFTKAGIDDDLATSSVYLCSRDARSNCVHSRLLRSKHHIEHVAPLITYVSNCNSSRHIGVVAVDQRTKINYHKIPFNNPSIRRPVMGFCAIWPRGHNRLKAQVGCTKFAHPGIQLEPKFNLCWPITKSWSDLKQRLICNCACCTDPRCLSSIFDQAKLLDDSVCGSNLSCGEQFRLPPSLCSPGNGLCLKANRSDPGKLGSLGDASVGVCGNNLDSTLNSSRLNL
jgi:hypothetical protein